MKKIINILIILTCISCRDYKKQIDELNKQIADFNSEFAKLQKTLPDAADKIDPLGQKELIRTASNLKDLNTKLEKNLEQAMKQGIKDRIEIRLACQMQSGNNGSWTLDIKDATTNKSILTNNGKSVLACPTEKTISIPADVVPPGTYTIEAELSVIDTQKYSFEAFFEVFYKTNINGNEIKEPPICSSRIDATILNLKQKNVETYSCGPITLKYSPSYYKIK